MHLPGSHSSQTLKLGAIETTRASLGLNLLGSCCYLLSRSLLQPHGLEPARLLPPWDFLGKNNGVGCHFLLQGIFPTLGLNSGLLHRQGDSLPLSHQGSPGPVQSVAGSYGPQDGTPHSPPNCAQNPPGVHGPHEPAWRSPREIAPFLKRGWSRARAFISPSQLRSPVIGGVPSHQKGAAFPGHFSSPPWQVRGVSHRPGPDSVGRWETALKIQLGGRPQSQVGPRNVGTSLHAPYPFLGRLG